MEQFTERFQEWLALYGPIAVKALVTLVVGWIVARILTGVVEEVQIFATVLKTPDNKRVIVPNSAITGGTITNYFANDTRRVDLVFEIGYGDDIEKAKEVLDKEAADG